MKLQRLELFGFKSFADRVTIEFNPGITAIVGPNGCGKSNISDAIRWVLGEQRPTLVRGVRMDEVIFGGTRQRKPINFAEVTLRFANEDGLLPVDYSEVAISRRVYRDGESEYLLNRNACRLKDVQDLFLGTGIGTHAYSLIQQGMVDSILSDRTEERRLIFDEAAGVTRYKARRKSAERKLEATTHDLQRVEDIVAEVEKTVTSLRRQVGKAHRFQQYRDEETRLDVNITAQELAALDERRAPLAEEMRALEAADAEQAARLAKSEVALEGLESKRVEARAEESAARAAVEELHRRIARREESQLVTGETLRNHGRRLESLESEAERARARAEELDERRANLADDLRLAAERVAEIAERLALEGRLDGVEAHQAELRVERAHLLTEVERLRERMADVRQAAARQSSAEESAAERAGVLSADLDAHRREAESARETVDRVRAEFEQSTSRAATRAEEVGRLRTLDQAATQVRDNARDQLVKGQAADQAAAARIEALAALEARFEGYARGARSLLEGEEPAEGILGALPQVIEPVEGRFEVALDRYIESLGHGLLVEDGGSAVRVARRLGRSGGGRADLLVPQFLPPGNPPPIPDGAAALVLARGEEAVRWRGDPAVEPRFRPLFSRLLLVADAEMVVCCRAALAGAPEAARFYAIASLDGTLLDPAGCWRIGGTAEEGGLLARRRRLAEAEAARADHLRILARLEDEVAAAERGAGEAGEALAVAVSQTAEAESARAAARAALALAEAAGVETDRRLAELEHRLDAEIEARDRAREAGRNVREAETEIEADLQRTMQRTDSVQSALERFDEVTAERLSERHAIELERSEAEADLRVVEREMEHLAGAEEALASARAERAAERVRLVEESAALEAEREAAGDEIESLHAELDQVEAQRVAGDETRRQMEEQRMRCEGELKTLRHQHGQTTERRHQCALAWQEMDHRRETLIAHIEEAWGADPGSLLQRHPLQEAEHALAPAALAIRLEEVRRKRANLGPVNMLAVEEHERESERYEFLSRQRDDLVGAKRQLEEAIRRINATARALFAETFEKVRENFDATFRSLFEGGHAEIRLADPEDPLESAIEIAASPRGKRVQSIGLLSGGERALTALSLLFAIYRVKPSPFCILDEVDAPLDDANVGRFLAMIRHFSSETQFVVITHNRRTMEAADFLYGVTMEEPGVSALVSVSLDGAEPKDAAESDGAGEEDDAPQEALAAAG